MYDQFYPSMTPGKDRIYFSEGFGLEYEYKKPKNSADCQHIKTAIIQPNQKFGTPYFIHQVINSGCVQSPVIAPDGKTIYYSTIEPENHKVGFKIAYASERGKEVWNIPNFLEIHEDLEGDKLNPRTSNENIFFLLCYKEKKEMKRILYSLPLPKEALPFKTFVSKGTINTKISGEPIEAEITVFNPTTLQVLSRYKSDKHTGEFELCLLDKKNYLVEIRKYGYSFANYQVNYKSENKQHIPELIQLFDTIQLNLNVFDREIFSPLEVTATAIDADNDKIIYQGIKTDKGVYTFKLPLGSNYNLEAYADWFDQNEFLFKLEGDIVFNKFDRNLPLTPQKNIFSIVTTDAETGAVFIAGGFLVNLSSDEPPIFFSVDDIDENGKVKVSLRKGDQYELTMNSEGYFFHNQVIDLQNTSTDTVSPPTQLENGEFSIAIKMDSLRTDKAITLDNITFGNNSAALSTETFKELDKVLDVIINNAELYIEISAHTDNVGSARYNNLLSNKRAQSVVNYLLENEAPLERIISKGYGFAQPKVPNDSDENRTINRRVEFRVISKEELVEESNN